MALGCRPCCWPRGSAGSPQCVRPMGGWFFPFPRPPYVCTCVQCPGPVGSCSPVCPLGALFRLCGVPGHLAPVHRCARLVCCVACAVFWATWLLFTGVPGRCFALRVRSPRATQLLFTGVPARCVALRVPYPRQLGSCSPVCPLGVLLLLVRCPGPLGSCSPVCPLDALLCVCGVLGNLAPVQQCARVVRCFACALSWATWLLFPGVPARCVVLRVWCPRPLGSCSPVRPLCALLCLCGVLGHLAPVHRFARSVRCFASAVSWATWLLFTGVFARCIALRVR